MEVTSVRLQVSLLKNLQVVQLENFTTFKQKQDLKFKYSLLKAHIRKMFKAHNTEQASKPPLITHQALPESW